MILKNWQKSTAISFSWLTAHTVFKSRQIVQHNRLKGLKSCFKRQQNSAGHFQGMTSRGRTEHINQLKTN